MRDRQYSIEDKYAFKEMVGQGQFGKVYKAKDKLSNSQELYAIKVISKTKFKTNSKLEQLISSEMKVLSEIRNENVVRFIEFGVTCKEVFMVYEFC